MEPQNSFRSICGPRADVCLMNLIQSPEEQENIVTQHPSVHWLCAETQQGSYPWTWWLEATLTCFLSQNPLWQDSRVPGLVFPTLVSPTRQPFELKCSKGLPEPGGLSAQWLTPWLLAEDPIPGHMDVSIGLSKYSVVVAGFSQRESSKRERPVETTCRSWPWKSRTVIFSVSPWSYRWALLRMEGHACIY